MRAFVLAGGRSRRMGQDKALLRWQGRPLIEHALEKLRSVDPAPRILGSRDDLAAFAPLIADNYAGMGPLAGIEAALAVSDSEGNLFLAVDVPLVPVEFLGWLAERAERTGAGATLPRLGGRLHPLCAVYHRRLHPHLRDALAAGEAKVLRAIPQAVLAAGLRVDSFDMEALAAADTWSPAARRTPLHRWLENWNSPQDVDPAGCSGAVNRAR